jgi:hypothetical protein
MLVVMRLALFFALIVSAFSQTGGLSILNGVINFGNAVHTVPMIVAANVPALPAAGCTVGELAIVTSATLGQQIYQNSGSGACVWTQQLNTGSSNGGGITVYSAPSVSLAGTQYIPIGGGGLPSGTEASVDTPSPSAATVTNFEAQLSAAPGAGNSVAFTWRKNAVSQSLTCTISGAVATSCSDTVNSFSVSQGDLLTIQLVTTGVIAGTPNLITAVQFGTVGSNGTVNTGTAGQVAYYATTGTAVSGENLFATNAQSGTYQVLASDFIGCKTIPVASGTFTITLVPSGTQPPTGQCIDVINYGSGVVTIARSGQNINGGTTSLTLPAASATAPVGAHIVSNGTDYFAELSVGASGSTVTNIKCNRCSVNATPLTNLFTNDTVTGTTVNKLAKLTGAPSKAIITTAGDTSGAIGIVDSGAGTSGSAEIAFQGTAQCVFDGATTAGHYVTISTSVNGDCTDGGATYPTGTQVIGRVLSTNGGGGTYDVGVFGPEFQKPTATAQQHSISFVLDGGGAAITTGDKQIYPTAAFACTINRIDISADQSGSITVDVWKAAGAIPTSGNKISASAPLTLSSAQLAQNGSLTGWTTSVSSGDVFGFSVATVSTVTRVIGQIWCQ